MVFVGWWCVAYIPGCSNNPVCLFNSLFTLFSIRDWFGGKIRQIASNNKDLCQRKSLTEMPKVKQYHKTRILNKQALWEVFYILSAKSYLFISSNNQVDGKLLLRQLDNWNLSSSFKEFVRLICSRTRRLIIVNEIKTRVQRSILYSLILSKFYEFFQFWVHFISLTLSNPKVLSIIFFGNVNLTMQNFYTQVVRSFIQSMSTNPVQLRNLIDGYAST